jgi:hypothetical protein
MLDKLDIDVVELILEKYKKIPHTTFPKLYYCNKYYNKLLKDKYSILVAGKPPYSCFAICSGKIFNKKL